MKTGHRRASVSRKLSRRLAIAILQGKLSRRQGAATCRQHLAYVSRYLWLDLGLEHTRPVCHFICDGWLAQACNKQLAAVECLGLLAGRFR